MSRFVHVTDPGSEAGFTLLEVLISLAILALAASLAIPLLVDAARKASLAQRVRMATLLAQSNLAGAGTTTPIQRGEARGQADGFDWTLAIAPYGAGAQIPSMFPLMEVIATVRWSEAGKSQAVVLKTLRLGSQVE